MYFSEPLTDFRTRLYTDDGASSVEVGYNVGTSRWQVVADKGLPKTTLSDMVSYLHEQFYLGEEDYLDDWLQVVDQAELSDRTTLTLKTVDRL